MSPEQIKRIGAYMQFDRQIYEQQGNGFGLGIVKKLLDIHQGKLTIESLIQQNITIEIRLKAS